MRLCVSVFVFFVTFLSCVVFAEDLTRQNFVQFEIFSGEFPGATSTVFEPVYALSTGIYRSSPTAEIFFLSKTYYGHFSQDDAQKRLLETDASGVLARRLLFQKEVNINLGLFFDYYYSWEDFSPDISPAQIEPYSSSEKQIPMKEKLNLGVIFYTYLYKRSLLLFEHYLKVYLRGTRVAPNLVPYKPLLSSGLKFNLYLTPKCLFLTYFEFFFQRKEDVALFNSHDGLAGTKREFDLYVGLQYYLTPKTYLYAVSFGRNNLNRGESLTSPAGFKDGYYIGFGYKFY